MKTAFFIAICIGITACVLIATYAVGIAINTPNKDLIEFITGIVFGYAGYSICKIIHRQMFWK